jgi:hypothetical protein
MQNDLKKRWVPSEYLDELPIQSRESPDDWIKNGYLDGDDEYFPRHPLSDGEIVQFDWCVDLGIVQISISEGGEVSYAGCELCAAPPGSEVSVADVDNLEFAYHGLPEFVENNDPGNYVIRACAWGCVPVKFAFVGGKLQEVPCAGS